MKRIAIVLLCACSHHSTGSPQADAAQPDAVAASTCTTGSPTKITFTRELGCGNDGSVEFCIPSNDAGVVSRVTAVSSTITCAPGGGRAMCNDPALLLCTYPTAFPGQCEADHGAMTSEVWAQMCSLSAFDEIHAIVPTIVD